MGTREVLKLYKSLLRESQKISPYNFRCYAIRRIKDKFRENKSLIDSNQILAQIQEGKKHLNVIKRQAVISQMYSTDKLVIENISK